MKERWAALCPDLSLEGTDIPFLDRLAESELYICDHISTTYLESIASNHPTLLIWHAEQEPLRPSAQPYFDALLKQGILHHNAEDAAKYLDGIVSDIPTWWQAPERQKVISDFRTHFALGSPNEIQEWVNEFLSLI
ncbi:MAG: hypothetical protein O3A01_08775 [bacterium]|nr:hypothetical protein [bacterium]